MAVPETAGSQFKGSAARIDLMKKYGVDVQAMYPAENKLGPGADDWTWENFLKIAQKANEDGHPFALPAGTFTDAVDWVGAMFRSYGADLVNADGEITVRDNENVKQVMDYAKRLFQYIPPEMFAADDATNNRALISGSAALIFNPPSAWAVAKRDAPDVAKEVWHFPSPAGPQGRFVPHLPYFYGVWSFSKNKQAAKDLLEHLTQIEQVSKLVAGVQRLRHPGLPLDVRQDRHLEECRAAEGHGLQLPGPQAPQRDAEHRAGSGAGRDRRADVQPGHPDQDDRPHGAEQRVDGRRAVLGPAGDRRLPARLTPG